VGAAEGSGLVFFIGLVYFDFGTEARRDSFKQMMSPVFIKPTTYEIRFGRHPDGTPLSQAEIDQLLSPAGGFQLVLAVPQDVRQMVAYLKIFPDEARSLIWTLNLELTPAYSVEPVGPYANLVYAMLVNMLDGQSKAETDPNYVERVSVPAVLSGQSIRLFSGQVVPELLVDATRGMYMWATNKLVDAALASLKVSWEKAQKAQKKAVEDWEKGDKVGPPPRPRPPFDEPWDELDGSLRLLLRQVLNKLYYQYRNLGITSPDRAVNFAATNIFQLTDALAGALSEGKTLDRIDVLKSPYCRVDSDCWDVQLKFFDPENTNRGYTVLRFTLDVSDKMPVTLGKLVDWVSTT
jgi:hypothetical protein